MKSMARSRWFAIALMAAMLCGCGVKLPVSGHTPHTDFGKATGPDGWEEAFWEAVSKKDYGGIERHLTTNYVWSSDSGRRDKAQFMELVKHLEVKSYAMTDVQVLPQGSDFVISYTLKLDGTVDGKPLAHPVTRLVSVWQQQKRGAALVTQGEWVANSSPSAMESH